MGMARWLAGLAGVVLLGAGVAAQDGKEGDPKPAQPADPVEAALDELFNSVDADKDGKITRDENYSYMRKQAIEAMGGNEEDLDDEDMLGEWGLELVRFLSADADDDLCATRAELRVFVRRISKGMKAPSLSAKDVDRLRTEITRPLYNVVLTECDMNGDKKLAAAEYEEFYGTEEKPDADKNGTITEAEIEALVFAQMQANTGIEIKAEADQQPSQDKPDTDKPAVEAPKGDQPKTDQPKVETPAEPDAFVLYRKKGRSWTLRTTTGDGATKMVSQCRYEVTELAQDYAMLSCTMLDSEGRVMEGIPATDTRVNFVVPAAGAKPTIKETVTIRVGAGEFECDVIEVGASKSWVSRKFPGLLVKSESSQNGWTTTQELTAFVE